MTQPTSPTLQDFKADLFRTLANPLRIRIIEALRAAGSLTVGEIQQRVDAGASNVSQHLGIMRGRGVLNVHREGTSARYSIADPRLNEILDAARLLIEQQLATQTNALRSTSA